MRERRIARRQVTDAALLDAIAELAPRWLLDFYRVCSYADPAGGDAISGAVGVSIC